MTPLEAFLYGFVGGMLAEIFAIWKLRHEINASLPPYLSSKFYWIMTFLMVGSGGALAFIYIKSNVVLSPLLAVNIGATAPLLIGSLTASPPKIGPESA